MTKLANEPFPATATAERLAKATVVIFTYRSPFSTVPEFVEEEWPEWRDARRVLVISLARDREESLRLTPNTTAYSVSPVRSVADRIAYVLAAATQLPTAAELVAIARRGPRHLWSRLRALAVDLQAAERYRRGLLQVLQRDRPAAGDPIVLYSYWLGAATEASLSLARELGLDDALIISRMHGSDVYEHANPERYLPFRRYVLKHIRAGFAISANGADYATQHWGCPTPNVHVAHLGIRDHFTGRFPARDGTFSILSCSYISDLKRVDMIAEAVSRLRVPRVRWIHVGGGPGELALRARCESLFHGNSSVEYELVGSLPHERTISLLQETNINVLVNASTSEGIPVSMMEAHCSGIPVIGPNVGGVGEIVRTGVNGILLEPPLSSDTLATAIQSIVEMRLEDYAALCVRARASWEERFSAAANYPAFVQAVAQLIPVSRTP